MTATLKDIEAALTKSIRPLKDLLSDINYEFNSLKSGDKEDVKVEFLIGLFDLDEAVALLNHKRDRIRKMIR